MSFEKGNKSLGYKSNNALENLQEQVAFSRLKADRDSLALSISGNKKGDLIKDLSRDMKNTFLVKYEKYMGNENMSKEVFVKKITKEFEDQFGKSIIEKRGNKTYIDPKTLISVLEKEMAPFTDYLTKLPKWFQKIIKMLQPYLKIFLTKLLEVVSFEDVYMFFTMIYERIKNIQSIEGMEMLSEIGDICLETFKEVFTVKEQFILQDAVKQLFAVMKTKEFNKLTQKNNIESSFNPFQLNQLKNAGFTFTGDDWTLSGDPLYQNNGNGWDEIKGESNLAPFIGNPSYKFIKIKPSEGVGGFLGIEISGENGEKYQIISYVDNNIFTRKETEETEETNNILGIDTTNVANEVDKFLTQNITKEDIPFVDEKIQESVLVLINEQTFKENVSQILKDYGGSSAKYIKKVFSVITNLTTEKGPKGAMQITELLGDPFFENILKEIQAVLTRNTQALEKIKEYLKNEIEIKTSNKLFGSLIQKIANRFIDGLPENLTSEKIKQILNVKNGG